MRLMDHSLRIRYLKGLVIAAAGLMGLLYSWVLLQGCDPISLMGQHIPRIYDSVGGCEYHTFTEVHDVLVGEGAAPGN